VGQTAVGPNEECLVFHLSFTKVIRGGKSKEFGVKRLEGDPSCPVNIFKKIYGSNQGHVGLGLGA
jgi:hypothetical protein